MGKVVGFIKSGTVSTGKRGIEEERERKRERSSESDFSAFRMRNFKKLRIGRQTFETFNPSRLNGANGCFPIQAKILRMNRVNDSVIINNNNNNNKQLTQRNFDDT